MRWNTCGTSGSDDRSIGSGCVSAEGTSWDAEREVFYIKDLLYSLMPESHNDSAVAVAEGIGGSVEEFAKEMNAKAAEIGCKDTHFITPNGLDAEDESGVHSTTAEDLAKIMQYCIMTSGEKEAFLEVTRTKEYQFQDTDRKRTFSCHNHNAFLDMMDGALSGKTGFTAEAGYCYVGSLRRMSVPLSWHFWHADGRIIKDINGKIPGG